MNPSKSVASEFIVLERMADTGVMTLPLLHRWVVGRMKGLLIADQDHQHVVVTLFDRLFLDTYYRLLTTFFEHQTFILALVIRN